MRQKKKKQLVLIVAGILFLIGLGFGFYVGDYYHAGEEAKAALKTDEEVTVSQLEDGSFLFTPNEVLAGLVFYPGGKVEHEAYAPLMREWAEQGVLCILVEMPFHLAVFDVNAADRVMERVASVENWFIGGHSLGGSMAASYAAEHSDEFEGLLLLASYSTADLRDTNLEVVSIYGSKDGVLNQESYEKYRENLPAGAKEIVIEGGCHAYFGDYGAQDGDGEATISREEQLQLTVEAGMSLWNK